MSKVVPKVLRRAAQVLDERGWTRGRYERRGRVCMVQAINVACPGTEFRTRLDCYEAVGKVIGEMRSLSGWNDEPGRKKSEVKAALLAAAERAEAGA